MSSAAPEVESPITAGRLRAPYLRTATARHSRPRAVYFRGAAGDISENPCLSRRPRIGGNFWNDRLAL